MVIVGGNVCSVVVVLDSVVSRLIGIGRVSRESGIGDVFREIRGCLLPLITFCGGISRSAINTLGATCNANNSIGC